jgi:folate-binding Fe-S cluster repair protein YgfZ
MTSVARLHHRAVAGVSGPDRVAFLNGLVSNDVALAAPGRAVWTALLTPQGRYLCDFFIQAEPDRLLLDAPSALVPELIRRLSRFRLRMKVELQDLTASLLVYAAWGGAPRRLRSARPIRAWPARVAGC